MQRSLTPQKLSFVRQQHVGARDSDSQLCAKAYRLTGRPQDKKSLNYVGKHASSYRYAPDMSAPDPVKRTSYLPETLRLGKTRNARTLRV